MALKALAINCTLKEEGEESSTRLLLIQIANALKHQDAVTEVIHASSFNIKPAVCVDPNNGDQWPLIEQKILESDILVMGTPLWMGEPSDVCKRVLGRLAAFGDERDDHGRLVTYGKVAALAVVGNDESAYRVSGQLYQTLNDVGFTLAPNARTYWCREALESKECQDQANLQASNLVHLAFRLKSHPYPGRISKN